MSKAIDYEKLAAAVAEKLARVPPIEKTVWDARECAHYLRVSDRQFLDRISKHHKFPPPINYPVIGARRSHPRWIAGEVIEWAKRQRERR